MNTKQCNLCKCLVTPTYAMKHLHEFADKICEHENLLQNIDVNISSKAPINNPNFTGTVTGVTKNMVGLENVDNTSDTNKPVSTLQQSALNLKSNIDSPTFTGIVNFSTLNINSRRVALNSDLITLVNSNSFVGFVLVNSDNTNNNLPSLYLVFNNTYFWIPSQIN